jgi:Domain of unknown function (DUF4288)
MWFGASLLYRSSESLDKQGTQLFEERIIVLDAADEGEAWKKAKERGPLLEERYTNAEGRWVAWTFERTVEVRAILEDQIADGVGVEVFSRFLRQDEVESLPNSMVKKPS